MSQFEVVCLLAIGVVVFLYALWGLYKIHLSDMDEHTKRMIEEYQPDCEIKKVGGVTPDDIGGES